MLRLKYLFENYDLAKHALKNWAHDEDTLDEMLSYFRISSNAIYPFYQKGEVCFLRLAPADEKLKKNIEGELEFISYLIAHGYPALAPIKAKTGEACLTLETKWGTYYASAFRKVAGVPLEDTELTGELMLEYGRALGRLHTLSADFTPKTKKWTHADALDWVEGVLREYSAPDIAVRELDAVRKELDALATTPDSYGLVHYDFELDNVFCDTQTNTCSVIDFDDGMYHWFALDIEQVFGSLEDELDGQKLETAKAEFLDGYTREHTFTREMESSLGLMRRFVNLYGYARLIRCVAETFDDEPEWLTKLREKLGRAISAKLASMRG